MKTTTIGELGTLRGERLTGEWRSIDQPRVDAFAKATWDEQWIHTDPERARRESPFGGTIAHGYLTLSIVPALLFELLSVRDAGLVINYGANRVRFPAPVPVGSRVRLVAELASLEEVPRGVQATLACTVEIEGGAKPALAAELLYRFLT